MADTPAPITRGIRRASGTLWLSMEQMAAATGEQFQTIAARAARGRYMTHPFPSDKHEGKTVRHVAVHRLEPALQAEVNRYLARFGETSPDACLAEIEAQYGADKMRIAQQRFRAVQQYNFTEPKTVVSTVTGRRVPAPAIDALCTELNVDVRTLQRWARNFDDALAGKDRTPEGLQRAFVALLPRQPGRVNPEKAVLGGDRRIRLTPVEELAIQGMWAQRSRPDYESVWSELISACLRCTQNGRPADCMTPADARHRGRYKVHTCELCGFALSYTTVRRVIQRTPPSAACLGREGRKAYDDKFARYAQRDWSGVKRSQIVYGDHHKCDLFVYDPRELTEGKGAPRLFRPWLSAWQDVATSVVAYTIDDHADGELLSLAFRSYVLRFGRPEFAWTDNGLDYLGQRFTSVCDAIGTEIHHTLPSRRGGESHAKSKPIERFFGTFERDFIQHLPGWCGSDTTQRAINDDVQYRMQKQHEEWVRTGKGASPFLSIDQFRDQVAQWIEGTFHRRPTARQDKAPMDCFHEDPTPLQTVGERALDILLLDARTRVVSRNGVRVDNLTYWSNELASRVGEPCELRMDPADRSKVVVLLDGRAVIAYTNRPAGWTRDDIKREATLKRDQRRKVQDAVAVRQDLAAGITAYHKVLAEKVSPEAPAKEATNGVPVLTPAHNVANQVAQAEKRAQTASQPQLPRESRVRTWQHEAEESEE